jgi:hypothetical protein
MYGQRVKQQSNEEYRATMVGKKKEHGKKERGKTQAKKKPTKCKKQSEA